MLRQNASAEGSASLLDLMPWLKPYNPFAPPPANPFARPALDDDALTNPVFWGGFVALCRVHGDNPRQRIPSLAKSTQRPAALLRKLLAEYLRGEARRRARTYPSSSTVY